MHNSFHTTKTNAKHECDYFINCVLFDILLFSILYFLIFEILCCFPLFSLSFVNLFIGKAFLTHVNNFRCSLDSH